MPNLEKYRALPTKQKALVALAVLIDGHDAGQILASGSSREAKLADAADDLARLAPELRIPLLGSLLRRSLTALEEES